MNDAPAFPAVPAERSVSENALPGAKVGVPVIATDVDGDLLGYRLQGAPEFEIDEDTGQIQVAPGVTLDRERTPSYEVTVTASDGKGGTDSITVTINVSNVNEAPTAVNDTATTDEDQSVRIDVLANDTDPDTERAALTVSVGRQPLNGTASVESDRTITYTPNANFAGENSFTYSVSDGSLSDAGSVTVTVEAVNDAPTFPSPTAARSVPEDAEADDNVGAPVTAWTSRRLAHIQPLRRRLGLVQHRQQRPDHGRHGSHVRRRRRTPTPSRSPPTTAVARPTPRRPSRSRSRSLPGRRSSSSRAEAAAAAVEAVPPERGRLRVDRAARHRAARRRQRPGHRRVVGRHDAVGR